MGPFAAACELYWAAGWRGVLPLPARAKAPPPRGWTGRGAPYPSWADVRAWADGPEGEGNIALRLPDGLIGLDVDDYMDRAGGAHLDELTRELGALPPTWISTARDDRSGIRFYRVPVGLRWPGQAAPGIEVIQAGHRYSVVAPSVHPETRTAYRWVGGPSGGREPGLYDLPDLPGAWIEYLTGLVTSEEVTPAELDDGEASDWLAACRGGEPCPLLRETAARAVGALRARTVRGSRHELALEVSRTLAAYGGEGHAGARVCLVVLRDAFLSAVSDDPKRDGHAEWSRMLHGAVRLAAAINPTPRQTCDCALRAGEGVQFDAAEPVNSQNDNGSVTVPGDPVETLISRMLTPAQVREIAAPAPLIEGLLTLDSASWLIARSGSYKSFVALDWTAHVAAGQTWMGREVTCGPVVYVVAEGVGGMGPRVRAWEQYHGRMEGDARFIPFPVQVAREDAWAALVEACKRIHPVLIVLDTQARITLGLDENDNSQMGHFVEAIERLRRSCGACVLVVHHIGRNGQDARGASAIDAAQDTELRLTRGADRRATLTIDKSRHAADDLRLELELFVTELDGGGSSLVVGTPLELALAPDWRANLTVNQSTLVDLMYDIFPTVGATKAELKSEARKRVRRPLLGAELEPMGESAFRRAWDSLVASGRFARVTGSQRYVVTGEAE